MSAPTKGKQRCRIHGGADGIGAPIKHAGRSGLHKVLRISERMDQILADPKLLSNRENVAVIEGLIQELGEGDDVPAERWAEALELCQEAIQGDPDRLSELHALLTRGMEAAERSEKRQARLLELMEHQAKHRKVENDREAKLGTSLSARAAAGMIGAVVAIVTEELTSWATAIGRAGEERLVLGRIGHRIRRLVAPTDGGSALPGG
jgi:hypothetical protein